MVKAKLYNVKGEEKGEIKLDPAIFEAPIKESVVHQVLVAIMANRRVPIAHTKTRGEIRGGGRKPWRQKGTGRARHGSIRSPLWRGGGVTFGPRADRNFAKKVNKKMRRKALFMVLSDKARENQISAIEKLELAGAKTRDLVGLLKQMSLLKSTLIVLAKMDKKIAKAANNLPKVEMISANSLNVYDVLKFNNILFEEKALSTVKSVYLKKSKKMGTSVELSAV
ncbi:50S ribosomal protein L4 [Candidatus Falkowbacteria bacterium]|nr:50S ribosomal protein L4 [Candidatus Falkowbacteria bacterium]